MLRMPHISTKQGVTDMKKEKTSSDSELSKGKTAAKDGAAPGNALKGRKVFWTEKRVETVVAVLLGITTLLSAWATWIGSLHSGIQSINFTKSNNMASEGNSEYNSRLQLYIADYSVWNALNDYYFELEMAKSDGDKANEKLLNKKIDNLIKQSASETLVKGIKWMKENDKTNPFEMPGINEEYFGEAQKKVDQSKEYLAEGQRDNTKGDSYNLVSVVYSLTLFLLGIVGVFKTLPNKVVVMTIAGAALIFAFFYMCTIPMPTGFDQMNFFEFTKK